MIALDDITEEIGATRVIPGGHIWNDLENIGSPKDTVAAELKIGDALIYTGKVVHGGGANSSPDRWRKAMHLSFVVGWLTPEEASPLDYADGRLSTRSERVRQLLGQRSYDPRPHFGGGLWLKHVSRLQDQLT